jgi:hypothetical protein
MNIYDPYEGMLATILPTQQHTYGGYIVSDFTISISSHQHLQVGNWFPEFELAVT